MSAECTNVSHHAQISEGKVGFHKQVPKCLTSFEMASLPLPRIKSCLY